MARQVTHGTSRPNMPSLYTDLKLMLETTQVATE